jgi:glycosyltransferase involved in cell wall biosynthesis
LNIDVIIPALDEGPAIGKTVRSIPRDVVRHVFVVDNGSRDDTSDRAREAGARVLFEPERGYGAACLTGIRALPEDTDVIVFLDGDASDDPSLIEALVRPIREGKADLVVGSRSLGQAEPGAITPQQRFGNALASHWLRVRFGLDATDLGPFRAISRAALHKLAMRDRNYGWTVEMQIKAAKRGLRYVEIPVPYKRRIGRSKVSGTVRGTIGASVKILGLLALHDFSR